MGKIDNLLLETPESYYWNGFILADGHLAYGKRLKICKINTDSILREEMESYEKGGFVMSRIWLISDTHFLA